MLRLALVGSVLCAALANCATLQEPDMKHGVSIIAHRGASAYAPENTMAAFRLASEQKANYFELDCTLSQDGEVIVIHDSTTDRTTGVKGRVADMTLAQLKALDAGSWKDPKFAGEPIPTLDESLDFAKGRIGVYIEIKDSADDGELKRTILDMASGTANLTNQGRNKMMRLIEDSGSRNLELTRKVIEAVRLRRMQQEVVIQSFSPVVCGIALVEAPEIRTEFLGSIPLDKPERFEDFLRWAYLLQPAGCNVNKDGLTLGRLGMFHASGMTCAVYTVNDVADMRRFAEWGVDAIITDKPDTAREVVRALGKAR